MVYYSEKTPCNSMLQHFYVIKIPHKYASILLRSSGNDNFSTLMRDGLMQTLVEDLDMETQAYRPSIVFLNGE